MLFSTTDEVAEAVGWDRPGVDSSLTWTRERAHELPKM